MRRKFFELTGKSETKERGSAHYRRQLQKERADLDKFLRLSDEEFNRLMMDPTRPIKL